MSKGLKNKVIFDTSFLIRAFEGFHNNGCNIIDTEFPSNNWDRIIHDYVIDEFFRIENEEQSALLFMKVVKSIQWLLHTKYFWKNLKLEQQNHV